MSHPQDGPGRHAQPPADHHGQDTHGSDAHSMSGPTMASGPTAPAGLHQGTDGSFSVHLDSLTDFGRELDTQVEGITKPSDGLAVLSGHPMLLGGFTEATSLGSGHQQSVTQMYDLLGQVKQAIVFAKDVTSTVSTGYRDTDEHLAGGLGAHTSIDPSTATTTLVNDAAAITHHGSDAVGTAVGATVAGVTGAIGATVAGVGATVAGAVGGPVGQVIGGVTGTVGHDVGSAGGAVGGTVASVLGGGAPAGGAPAAGAPAAGVPDAGVPDTGSGQGAVPGPGGLL